jgi:hypothetical protein
MVVPSVAFGGAKQTETKRTFGRWREGESEIGRKAGNLVA